ncbi:MAG: dipeptide epimerase [Caldilineales bacterium]|nr:dipeptide epimerase [Caldilineales bacterium]
MPESQPPFSWQDLTLRFVTPFRVSYGATETRKAHWLRLADDAGWGEGTIPPYYGVAETDMIAYWQRMAARPLPLPDRVEDIPAWVGEDGPAPACAAIDLALHDRIAKLQGLPLYELLGLPQPPIMATSFTIGIDEPEQMAVQALAARAYPILKLKLGGDDDVACVAAVRAARPDARLYVDANAAWVPEQAVSNVRVMTEFGLELIEQPTAKADIEGMGYVQRHIDLPIVADESLQSLADVERLAEAGVRGINLKLMKVGGLGPGLRVLQRARELGMQIMLGCMIETAIGVTAVAHLAGMADWLDLDAPLLVANHPFTGVRYDEHGFIHMPERPGIGVVETEE